VSAGTAGWRRQAVDQPQEDIVMGVISVNTDDLNSTGARLGAEASNLSAELQTFNAQVTALLSTGQWQGQGSAAFQGAWAQFTALYQQMVTNLQDLGVQLTTAGQTYSTTDQQVAQSIGHAAGGAASAGVVSAGGGRPSSAHIN
jgi:WXG100 family type VII secretion target